MTLNEIIDLLNDDLANERKHLMFYLYHSSNIESLHREELKDFLLEEAKGEMNHVLAFQDLIIGLGGETTRKINEFPNFSSPIAILHYAQKMENEVVENYVKRIEQVNELGGKDGKWIEIFLEDQIADSRKDLDNINQMLKGNLS